MLVPSTRDEWAEYARRYLREAGDSDLQCGQGTIPGLLVLLERKEVTWRVEGHNVLWKLIDKTE